MMQGAPIRLEIDYTRWHDTRSVVLRYLLALPILVILGLFVGSGVPIPVSWGDWVRLAAGGYAPGFLMALGLATAAMITFRRRYPRWWFEAHAELVRFGVRVLAYLLLLTDRYPSTDRETDVRVFIETPPVDTERDRRIAFVKPLLAIPHLAVLLTVLVFAFWLAFWIWLRMAFGMRCPRRWFDFAVAGLQYGLDVYAYAFLHLTDRYPRFRRWPLAEDVMSGESERATPTASDGA
jgi:hypothetical protein